MTPAPQQTGLPSSQSMFAYPSAGMYGGVPYPSAMDGPFKFYATPPSKQDSDQPRPSAGYGAGQTAPGSAPAAASNAGHLAPGNPSAATNGKSSTSKKATTS